MWWRCALRPVSLAQEENPPGVRWVSPCDLVLLDFITASVLWSTLGRCTEDILYVLVTLWIPAHKFQCKCFVHTMKYWLETTLCFECTRGEQGAALFYSPHASDLPYNKGASSHISNALSLPQPVTIWDIKAVLGSSLTSALIVRWIQHWIPKLRIYFVSKWNSKKIPFYLHFICTK